MALLDPAYASHIRRSAVLVRAARTADMPSIQRIYARQVLHGLASFEEQAPSTNELLARREKVLCLGLPYLVAEDAGQVVGFSYATSYRQRPAYRHTVENSVYVAEGRQGRGIGRSLLSDVIARCEAGAWRQMIAVIGNSANKASIALHESLGFSQIGILRAVGFKHGQWVDTVLLQRPLGQGSGSAPQVQTAAAM